MLRSLFILIIAIIGLKPAFSQNCDTTAVRESIDMFLNSKKDNKEKHSRDILKLDPDFNYLYKSLKQGKRYSASVPKGFVERNYINNLGIEHPNLVFIPYKYDPQKKYPIRIHLHGGVSTFDMRRWVGSINRNDTIWNSLNTITIFPASWTFSKWWNYSQYENISNLLEFVKENYNVDENRISLTGISDGGTGIYYLSNFYQTPFSCYLPFIGSMETLLYQNNKEVYMNNYQGLNFFVVNGRKDKTFDINFVIPTINTLKKVANEVKFFVVDSSAHSTNWYPVLKDSVKMFIEKHKRNPLPNLINYSTEKPDTFGRKFWVKIDKIGIKKGQLTGDINTVVFNGEETQLFPRRKVFGQIEVSKIENTVYVKTKNVIRYTLLISPNHFDFGKSIEVYTNGILSFKGFVSKSLETLLKYYTLDNDREMLYASELEIKVGREYKESKESSH